MKIGLVLLVMWTSQLVMSQTTLTLQPNAEDGKDGHLVSRVPDGTNGDHPDFLAAAWTHSGDPVFVRSLIEFDLSELPEIIEIESATLFLYGYDSPHNTGHASLDGVENHAYISRVTSDWEEDIVTWNTQPTITETNQVYMEGTNIENLDYEIDVKVLVEDLLLFPDDSYGFMFHLVEENIYNSLLFASSDNENADLHPKLEIVYKKGSQVSIDEKKNEFKIYPNPTNGNIYIVGDIESEDVKLYSIAGQEIAIEITNQGDKLSFDTQQLANGTYYLNLNGIKKRIVVFH